MNQKDYKISIRSKEIVIKEAGLGATILDNTKTAVSGVKDSLKMVGLFLKRSWGSTFGYAWNIRNNIKKHGFPAGLEYANKEFIQKDKQTKREMTQLINSQPGTKDANLFVAMTCPAAKAFSMFSDLDLQKSGYGSGYGSDYGELTASHVQAVYNLLTAISHISHNTPTDNIAKNNEKLTTKERKANKKKKYVVDERVLANKKSKEFIRICKEIVKLDINLDQKTVLDMLIEKVKVKEIINYVDEREISSTIVGLANLLIKPDAIKAIKFSLSSKTSKKTKDKEPAKDKESAELLNTPSLSPDAPVNASYSILKFSNKKLVLEEENPDDSQVNKEKPISKEVAELAYYYYFVTRSLTNIRYAKINASIHYILNMQSSKLLNSFQGDKPVTDFESSISEKEEEIKSDIDKYNKQAEVYNKRFGDTFLKIENTILDDISKNNKAIVKKMQESLSSLKSIENEEEKKYAISKQKIDVIEKIKSQSNKIRLSVDFEKSTNEAIAIAREDTNENILPFNKTYNRYSDVLSSVGISDASIDSIKNLIEQCIKAGEESKVFEDQIETFTKQLSELQSIIEEFESNKKQSGVDSEDDKSTSTVELSDDILDNKK